MRDTGRSHSWRGRAGVTLVVLALGWGAAGCAGTDGRTTTTGSAGPTTVSPAPAGPVASGTADAPTLQGRTGLGSTPPTSADEGGPEEETGDDTALMPDLTGAHMGEARRLLAGTPVRLLDRSGVDLGDSGDFGVVCAQTPPPGAREGPAPATLTVADSTAEC
ncbi:hypothetical protein GCM10009818_27230 [Nakamurella flavida]